MSPVIGRLSKEGKQEGDRQETGNNRRESMEPSEYGSSFVVVVWESNLGWPHGGGKTIGGRLPKISLVSREEKKTS